MKSNIGSRVEKNPEKGDGKTSGGVERFLKDKRRTASGKAPVRGASGKRSFNPNFDGRNRLKGGRNSGGTTPKQSSERPERVTKPGFERLKSALVPSPRGRRFDKARSNAGKPKQPGLIRLNRFIASSGVCSRREADEYISTGSVTVNGRVVTELGTQISPQDDIRLDGTRLHGEKKVYIVMNKPKGFVTTVEDPHTDKPVVSIVRNLCKERVYPVGRLDKNSVGVLILTNDGELTKILTHPSYNRKKIYQVTLDKPLSLPDMEKIAEGITLEDGLIAADEIAYIDASKKEIGIEIHSGRNRIIRRIFEHLGYRIAKLDRVYFAGLTKMGLKRGAWRYLTPREAAMLKSGNYE